MADAQVNAGADDGRRSTGNYEFSASDTTSYLGYRNDPNWYQLHHWYRFTGLTLSGTVTSAHLELYAHSNGVGSPLLKVYGADSDAPPAPTTPSEFDGLALTTAAVDWDGAWTKDQWMQSPDLSSIFQELLGSYTIENDPVMLIVKNDGASGADHYNRVRHYEYDSAYAAKLTVICEEGVGGERVVIRLTDTGVRVGTDFGL